MPQFDVFRTADGNLLLDCQSDALGDLATCLAAPLLPPDRTPAPRAQLNPIFDVNGQHLVMMTQFAATISRKELQQRIGSLDPHRLQIIGAFDMLLTGV